MTKHVALSNEAYEALAGRKGPGQSFSDVVLDLVAAKRPSIREVSGLLADDSTYWKRYAAKRRIARMRTEGRVRL